MARPPKSFIPFNRSRIEGVAYPHNPKKMNVMRAFYRVKRDPVKRFLVTMEETMADILDQLASQNAMTRTAMLRALIRKEAVRVGLISSQKSRRLAGSQTMPTAPTPRG